MKLGDLAKGVAAQLKINLPVVRTVLLARGSSREMRSTLAEAGVDRELAERIGNCARTLIHEELNRLDLRAHPPAKKPKLSRGHAGPPRGRPGPPRRRRP